MSRLGKELGEVKQIAEQSENRHRADRREVMAKAPWIELVRSYVDERERYETDREAVSQLAPLSRRGWFASNDRLLALIAVLDAWQDWHDRDENGVRRSVPAGVEALADVLTVLGFGDDVATETLDRYVREWLNYLRRSRRLVMVREAKRVSRDKGDADAREYLTYFGGREIVANEPHAEPLSWKKPKIAEQPRQPREPREPLPMPSEYAKRLEAERLAWAKWDEQRKAPKPVRTMTEFVQHLDAGGDGRPHVAAMRRLNGIANTKNPPVRTAEPKPLTHWLGAIASGKLSLDEARRRGFVTAEGDGTRCQMRQKQTSG